MPSLTGQSIGRYHILEQLGEGGMATVYKAYDTRLERDVAIKVLRTDLFGSAIIEQILKRFEREAKSLAKLSHSNIVNILDYGEHEDSPYLVMEYLSGGTLKQRLGQIIPWQESIHILLPVAHGLAYAHQHGVIHRDVKPANILMKEGNVPILTDFGIAKLLEGADGHTLTASGVGIGTPEYMAPEQGIGASTIDARADIYSLGIVLYEMVTGRKPYIADTPMAVVLKQMTDPLPHPTDFVPDLPEDVEHILFKALAKQPEDRYEDMNAFITAMERVLTTIPKTEVLKPVKRVMKKRATIVMPPPKVIMAIAGAIIVILVIAFGGSWVIKQFSVESAARATSTKVSVNPSSTFTMSPPTETVEPSPSPTLTITPRPTATNAPIPVWVTNFAEPIIKDIQSREPDFQDSFEKKSNFWAPRDWCASHFKVENGVLKFSECHVYWTRNYDNFAVTFDLLLSGSQQFNFYVRQTSSFPGCSFGFQTGGRVFWECFHPSYSIRDLPNKYGSIKNILIIVQSNQFALFVNESPITLIEVDILKYGDSWLAGSGQIDNFKLWKLDGVDH